MSTLKGGYIPLLSFFKAFFTWHMKRGFRDFSIKSDKGFLSYYGAVFSKEKAMGVGFCRNKK